MEEEKMRGVAVFLLSGEGEEDGGEGRGWGARV